MGRIYGRSATDFAAEAMRLALQDAGLDKRDVDGLLMNVSMSPEMSPALQMALGLEDVTVLNAMSAWGSTAGTMLQYASMALDTGQAQVVALVFADAPLTPGRRISQTGYGGKGLANGSASFSDLQRAYGDYGGANTSYALAANRHMSLFGTTSEQLGAIAVAERQWAVKNPWAQMREPMTIEDHQNSRYIVEPLHLLDCCLVSNGAVALIMTSADRARDLRQPPVFVRGVGQCCPGDNRRAGRDPAVQSGATISGQIALKAAGITLGDVDVLELYDCFTYTVLVTLEDYGFCEKGEGGPFVEDGKLGPGGSLPTNTGGGQLSGYYMWGFTPLSEGVVQARGQGGDRQVPKHDMVLVSGNGGTINFHSTSILSPHPS
ncbi:MAG: thiolase family protein [Acidimicrobiaceae bacterium]|nr:thiolase family protein [Acidimicrobiaceae bacterium]